MSDPGGRGWRRDERALAGVALGLGLAVALLPLPPATDWPQHLALATLLRRLRDGDPGAGALFLPNAATHNAGVHVLLAAAAPWIDVSTAGRLLLGLYPPLLLGAAARLLRRLDLPAWRALLLVPAVLGFSFGWGLANFCLGSALAWLLVDAVLGQLDHPRISRAGWLAVGSLALGVTHVMAMLLACLVAAAAAAERVARAPAADRPRRLARAAAAGALLLPGCVYDIHIYLLHMATAAGAYTSPPVPDEPGLLRKLGLLGALLSGLFTSYADTALAWLVVGLLGWLAWRGRGGRAPLLAPLPLLGALYLLTPSVTFNTHLVFQRLPQWALLAALLALPSLPAAVEAQGRRGAIALAGLYLLLLPAHLALHHRDARGAVEVLRATPRGVCVTGAIEEARTLGVRMHTLTHAAALGVLHGASDEAFSFARWMGLPVVYRPAQRPPYPARSWEHDGRSYDPADPLARRCPVVLVRTAWAEEPTDQLQARVFGAWPARVLARSGSWLLVDTR